METKVTLGGYYYIGAQHGAYRDWLSRIAYAWSRLTSSLEPPIGTRNHAKLRRWFRDGKTPYEACSLLNRPLRT